MAASASEEGRRNTTLALGALTGYLFTRGGNKLPAFLGLAGTAYAYKRYDDAVRARHAQETRLRAAQLRSSRLRSARLREERANRTRIANRNAVAQRSYYRTRREDSRHDNGLHLGWQKGRGNPHRR